MLEEGKNLPLSLPKSLGEILEQSLLLANSDSTLRTNSGDLQTTGSEKGRLAPTGKPLSETGLQTLRNIAQSVQSGKLLDDKMLETLLVQHFGSSRFTSRPKIEHIRSQDGGYDQRIVGYEIKLDTLHDEEMKLFDALEFFNAPASAAFLAKQIARLRTVMARTNESNQDIAVLIDTYADILGEYPPDAVKGVCDHIMRERKWFPLISEMRREMEDLVSFRCNVLKCFEECRNPMLGNKHRAKFIESDPRLEVHWKMLAKEKWRPQHYEWWVGEAQDMLRMANEMPAYLNEDMWQTEVLRRRAEMEKAYEAV
jgi:hypothetical protein